MRLMATGPGTAIKKRAGNFENRQVQTLTYIQLLHKLHTQNQRQPLVVGDMLQKRAGHLKIVFFVVFYARR